MTKLPRKTLSGSAAGPSHPMPARTAWSHILLRSLFVLLIGGFLLDHGLATAAVDSFRLGTGDKLRITVFQEPDLTGEYSIGSNGNVSIPLIGSIGASGLTVGELEQVIITALADGLIRDPKVSVEVLEARPFYILGDVTAPGSYPYVNNMTVLNAIALAGGNLVTEEDEVEARLALVRDQEKLALLIKDYRSAIAYEARLRAQRDGAEQIAFPAELLAARDDPEVQAIMNGERRVFQSEKELVESKLELLTEKASRIEEQIAAYNVQIAAVEEQVALINAQLRDQNELFEKGLTRSMQVADLKRDIAAAKITRAELQVDIASARQSLSESRLGMVEVRNEALRETTLGLQEVQKEISRLRTSIQTAREEVRQDRLKLGRTRAVLASDQSQRVVITRQQGSRVVEIEADEETPVAPGDIIRIITDVEAQTTISGLLAPEQPVDFQSEEARPLPPTETSPLSLAAELDRAEQNTAAPPANTPEFATTLNAAPQDAAGSVGNNDELAASETDPVRAEPAATADLAETAAAAPDQAVRETAVPEDANDEVPKAAEEVEMGEAPEAVGPEAKELESLETGGEPAEPSAQSAASRWAQLVSDVQTLLKSLGYGESPRLIIDGIMGPRTQAAIESFQANHGLESDGQPSQSLLDRLTNLHERLGGQRDPRIVEAADTASSEDGEDPMAAEAATAPNAGPVHQDTQAPGIASRSVTLGAAATKGLVQLIQERLIEFGYGEQVPITPNGLLGPPTRTAIARYQRDSGLPEDGRPSLQLLTHMDKQADHRQAGEAILEESR